MTELEKIKEEMKGLQDRIEELEKQQGNPTVWTPKDGESMYTLFASGTIMSGIYDEKVDMDRLNQGSLFPTEEEAVWEREHRKVLHEMKQYAREFVRKEDNCSIYYDYESEIIRIQYWYIAQHALLYFDSEEKAQACIDAIGEERLKKYYFNVKE